MGIALSQRQNFWYKLQQAKTEFQESEKSIGEGQLKSKYLIDTYCNTYLTHYWEKKNIGRKILQILKLLKIKLFYIFRKDVQNSFKFVKPKKRSYNLFSFTRNT